MSGLSNQSNRRVLAALASLICCCGVTGCLVAGYSSAGGFWIWPGSILITVILVILFFFGRR